MGRNDTFLEIFCVSYSKSRVFYRPELNRQNRVLYKVSDGLQKNFLAPSSQRMEKTDKCKAFCTLACADGRYLQYQTFPYRGRQTQRYFNVSTSSSRRDN